jgi:hypothetical protein
MTKFREHWQNGNLTRIITALSVIGLIIGFIIQAMAVGSWRTAQEKDVAALQECTKEIKAGKVEKTQYESDIGYIKDGIKEIKFDLKRHINKENENP